MTTVRSRTRAGPARIVLGGRFGEEPRRLSWQRLDRFAEAGGRYVDTAHCYAEGRSERTIGEWLRANPGTLGVIDKIGHPRADGTVDLRATTLRTETETSLRRLGIDTIDVLLLHRDRPRTPITAIADTLAGLVTDGLAAEIGVSNWAAGRLESVTAALGDLGPGPNPGPNPGPDLRPVTSYQRSLAVPGRPLWPGARHAGPAVADVLRRRRLLLLAWAGQARGFFAGRSEPTGPATTDPFDSAANRARRDRARAVAAELGVRPETVALAWLLHRPGTRAIIGPRTLAELERSLAAAALVLEPPVLRRLAGRAG